jgi:Xaa-Pro aminopeptidase
MNRKLQAFLDEQKLDALLLIGDSLCDPDLYYFSHFLSGDRFALLGKEGIHLLVSSMERSRACKESSADEVVSTSDYGIMEKLKSRKTPEEAYVEALSEFLRDRGARRLAVPSRSPAGICRCLSSQFDLEIVDSPVSGWRAAKSRQEIEAIWSVQRAGQSAMGVALRLLSRAQPRGDTIYWRDRPLTSEKVREVIELHLLKKGCDSFETIVAGGLEAVDPHARGSGPLPANAPIVVDIFPRSKTTRYFGDMTRTVVRGEASQDVQEIYQAVLAAQEAGLGALRAGVSGREVHARVCQAFAEHGFPEREGKGFIHSTGHGVGLSVHERPSLGEAGEILEANMVVTVEPGLYYPGVGGIRLEDLAVVTKTGSQNLTNFSKRLVL